MKSHWNIINFENADISIIDGDRGKNYPSQGELYKNEFCLFLSAKNVSIDGFQFVDCQFITKEKDAILRNGKLERNDIVLTTRGTVGNVGFYDNNINYNNVRINSGMVIFRFKNPEYLSEFYYHFFRSKLFTEQVASRVSGSAQPQLPIKDLKCIEIPLPPIPEQKAIAEVLSALDDKIKHNLLMNNTLEEMVMALYKHWFVDFGPFKNGKFFESEIGMIPEGWKVYKLEEVCERIFSGGTPSTEARDYWNGDIPWLSSGETRNKYIIETDKYITKLGLERSSAKYAKKGDIVIASAGQGKTRGQTSYLLIDTTVNQSVLCFRAKAGLITSHILFMNLSMRYDEFRHISDSFSTRGSLTKDLIGSQIRISLPSFPIESEFQVKLEGIFEQIENLIRENCVLIKTRDYLLPKLISGEIRVKDAEIMAKELV